MSSCLWRRTTSVKVSAQKDKPAPKSSSGDELASYIRGVLKISGENTAAESEAIGKLLETRPDLKALGRRAATDAKDVESRKQLAGEFMDRRFFASAYQLYQEVLSVAPRDAAAELGVARVWFEWSDYEQAAQHAEQAVALDPASAGALDLLGRIEMRSNDVNAAAGYFLAAARVQPDNARILANAGYALMLRGDLPRARTSLEQALGVDGSLVEAHNNLGIVLAKLGEPDGALRQFLEVNEPPAAFNDLGVVYLEQKKWREARDAFQRALALDPEYRKAQVNLADATSHMPLPTVIEIAPLSENRGRTVAKNVDSATSNPLAASHASPEATGRDSRMSAAYKDALGRYYHKHYQEAIDIFKWLLQQYPTDKLASNCQYWTGECYFGMGKYSKAYASFKQVTAYSDSLKRQDAIVMMRRSTAMEQRKARG
jgi:tetratricopeptide (TPR) repeat protein